LLNGNVTSTMMAGCDSARQTFRPSGFSAFE